MDRDELEFLVSQYVDGTLTAGKREALEARLKLDPSARTVLQEFRMGKLASTWETFVGRNPKQAVIENLRHFKALAETGEIPRTQTQPHGDRGVIGKMKASTYGEKIPTPPGSN